MEKNYLLYLSGVINENQYYEGTNENETEGMEMPEFKKLMSRLTVKLGDKANKYVPLLRYIAKNKNLLPQFEGLVEDLMKLQASTGKGILKSVDNKNKPENK